MVEEKLVLVASQPCLVIIEQRGYARVGRLGGCLGHLGHCTLVFEKHTRYIVGAFTRDTCLYLYKWSLVAWMLGQDESRRHLCKLVLE